MPVDEKALLAATKAFQDRCYAGDMTTREEAALCAAITAYEAAKPAPVSPAMVTEEEIARALFAEDERASAVRLNRPWDDLRSYQKDAYLTKARAVLAIVRPAIEAAVAAEREACAKVAEDISQVHAKGWYENPKPDGCGGGIAASNTGFFIAAAIRSRSQESETGA
jgi:hypothetical protein